MAKKINELEKQIAEKNTLLNSLYQEKKTDRDSIRDIKLELDKLLDTYYKSLKCKCSGPAMFFL